MSSAEDNGLLVDNDIGVNDDNSLTEPARVDGHQDGAERENRDDPNGNRRAQ